MNDSDCVRTARTSIGLALHGACADVGLLGLNDASSVKALHCRQRMGIDPEIQNVNGGFGAAARREVP